VSECRRLLKLGKLRGTYIFLKMKITSHVGGLVVSGFEVVIKWEHFLIKIYKFLIDHFQM